MVYLNFRLIFLIKKPPNLCLFEPNHIISSFNLFTLDVNYFKCHYAVFVRLFQVKMSTPYLLEKNYSISNAYKDNDKIEIKYLQRIRSRFYNSTIWSLNPEKTLREYGILNTGKSHQTLLSTWVEDINSLIQTNASLISDDEDSNYEDLNFSESSSDSDYQILYEENHEAVQEISTRNPQTVDIDIENFSES